MANDLEQACAQHPLVQYITAERRDRLLEVIESRLASVTLVFEDACDPYNLAAVLRSAEAFGLQHVHVVEHGKNLAVHHHTSAGAQRWLQLHRHDRIARCLGALQAEGFEAWGADVNPNAVPVEQVPVDKPVVIVLGSEKVGLSKTAHRHLDGCFFVPMQGFTKSFNVSVAAALSLNAICQNRRRYLQKSGDLGDAEKQELLDVWLHRSVRRAQAIMRARERRRLSSR